MTTSPHSTTQPAFRGFLKASGQAEVWDDTDKKKFDQFGWRTRTNESAFSSDTLIGNWNEERFDVSRLAQPRCLPSQVRERERETQKFLSGLHNSQITVVLQQLL